MDLGVIHTLGTNLSLDGNNSSSRKAAKKQCKAKKNRSFKTRFSKELSTLVIPPTFSIGGE
jgi:hypothetical protein